VNVIGSLIHSAADFQRMRFKQRGDSAGRILQSGLWAYSRHPNYFGDFLIYVSWAILAVHPWGWTAPAANLLQYLFDAMPKNEAWARERYGTAWAEYARRTSQFVPAPPRR
jgi:steroid 5-alpha reductase family enzyme